jgi:hypothetical protein
MFGVVHLRVRLEFYKFFRLCNRGKYSKYWQPISGREGTYIRIWQNIIPLSAE